MFPCDILPAARAALRDNPLSGVALANLLNY